MFNRLSEIRSHNTNKITIAELNINSIHNKFEQLVENIDINVDILFILETKLDDSFPINQFYIEGYQQFRSDCSSHGGGLILYVRDNIPTKQLKQFCIHDDIEAIAIEINLWKRKWLICGSYNPQENKIIHHLDRVGKLIDFYLSMYENIILLGDYNCEEKHSAMEEFLHTFNLKNLVKKPTRYKSVNNPCTIDLILTNKSKSFFKNDVIETGLSDFHQMPLTILKSNYIKCKPKQITYRNYNNFEIALFRQHLTQALQVEGSSTTYTDFHDIYINILNEHAPLKRKYVRGNDKPFMTKKNSKSYDVSFQVTKYLS